MISSTNIYTSVRPNEPVPVTLSLSYSLHPPKMQTQCRIHRLKAKHRQHSPCPLPTRLLHTRQIARQGFHTEVVLHKC
jgi:hypothetical protein